MRWGQAVHLYSSGLLYGINSLKASTAKQNPMPGRLHGPNEGILIFYCGPSEDKWNIMEYGRNILNKMNYPRTYFFYKSDLPHLIDYYKPYRHLYYINTLEHYGNHFAHQRNNLKFENRNYSILPNSNKNPFGYFKNSINRYPIFNRNIISPIFRELIS